MMLRKTVFADACMATPIPSDTRKSLAMNLLHPRWGRVRDHLWVWFFWITLLAWLLGLLAEPPWWWALFPTAVLLALAWWMVKAHPPPPRRNRIGQLVS